MRYMCVPGSCGKKAPECHRGEQLFDNRDEWRSFIFAGDVYSPCVKRLGMETPSLSLKDTGRIYLDHNATTPLLHGVLDNLASWAIHWGNPSSIHWSGRGPKNILRDTRAAVARLLHVHPLEIIFTSGGSESNNLVIKGVFDSHHGTTRNEYITTTVEHPSVMKSFSAIEGLGAKVHYLSVSRDGKIDKEQYKKLLSERTALVSIMAANNETGTIFPIRELTEMAHAVGAQFHTDAVQTLGKLHLDLPDWNVDFASFAAHKFYSLKGAGVVYAKKGQKLESLISGGGQERGRRAGTENILALASFGFAASTWAAEESEILSRVQALRDFMESEIQKHITGVEVTAVQSSRLGNTSSLLIYDIDGESLLINLDLEGVSVSTGAACSSGSPEPSPVLLAMGLTRAEAQRSLRVSLGWSTTTEEVETFVKILVKVVDRLRRVRSEARENEAKEDEERAAK